MSTPGDEQAEAAEILMVSRPRVSDVVNMKVSKFTIDTLVNMFSRVGKPVRLPIGQDGIGNVMSRRLCYV
jgi:predicted XRE-type DNA-binding protein